MRGAHAVDAPLRRKKVGWWSLVCRRQSADTDLVGNRPRPWLGQGSLFQRALTTGGMWRRFVPCPPTWTEAINLGSYSVPDKSQVMCEVLGLATDVNILEGDAIGIFVRYRWTGGWSFQRHTHLIIIAVLAFRPFLSPWKLVGAACSRLDRMLI